MSRSEHGTYKAVKARFWPWLSCKNLQNVSSHSLFAGSGPHERPLCLSGARVRVWGLRFGVQGLEFGVQGPELSVERLVGAP